MTAGKLTLTRTCVNAIRTELKYTPSDVRVLAHDSIGCNITFYADGNTYKFHADKNPSRFSKQTWTKKELWTLQKIEGENYVKEN